MNFNEVVAQVVDTTKRPEKINTIYRKVNAAISFYSLDNEFQRDFEELLLPISNTLYKQSFALSALPRFRKFRYIKLAGTRHHIHSLAGKDIFEAQECPDRYYIAGDYVHIFTSKLAANLDIGYWKYPPILTTASANNTYWMLDVAPFMVIDRACAEIFRDVGDEKSYQTHMGSAREAYLAAIKDFGLSTQ